MLGCYSRYGEIVMSPSAAWATERGIYQCSRCGGWHGGLLGRLKRFLWWELGWRFGPYKDRFPRKKP